MRHVFGQQQCVDEEAVTEPRGVARFPDGESVHGFQQPKPASGSGFIVIICALLSGAVVLGYFAVRGCSMVP